MSEANAPAECQASISANELHGSVLAGEVSRPPRPLVSAGHFSRPAR